MTLGPDATPILDTLKALVNQPDAPFYTPGHKRGEGIAPSLSDFLGNTVFKADLPELPELDNLFAPQGVIEAAQILASAAFGAKKTWFLINGSSCGIIAAILATCGPDQKIILPRNIHQSVISGLILSGARPVFITPEYNAETDMIYSITPRALEKTLQAHRDAGALMIVYPTYQGICGDLEALVRLTHDYNLPVLVDEAHGAHFAFHPDLPPSALSLGADLSIQSTHKVLGAMTQASMLHLNSDRIDAHRLSQALQLVQTTSPSYLLLASLDVARHQMATVGFNLLQRTLNLAQTAREQLSEIPYIKVLSLPEPVAGFRWLDTTRLTIGVEGLGLTGYQVDEILRTQFHVTAELPLLRHITFIISIGNNISDIEQLIYAFKQISPTLPTPPTSQYCSDKGNLTQCHSRDGGNPPTDNCLNEQHCPTSYLSPREAFFAPTQTVILEQALGKISAELICPYPPGIPILMPGEVITDEALTYLQTLLSEGAVITGCSDGSLKTVKICQYQ